MRIEIVGRELPGRTFARPDGSEMADVHVGVQVGKAPVGLVRGDAPAAAWTIDVRAVVGSAGDLDFRGPAVHGKLGERFLYLTWGNVAGPDHFEMFRRAKLMLASVPADLIDAAVADENQVLRATVSLTDDRGNPRCARVAPPAVEWSLLAVGAPGA